MNSIPFSASKFGERELMEINSMPRPRDLCLNWGLFPQWLILIAVASGFVILSFAIFTETGDGNKTAVDFLLPPAVSLLSMALLVKEILREIKNRELLMSGKCVAGIVISQTIVGRRPRQSEISHEFKDSLGGRWHGVGIDSSFRYQVGDSVAVFYAADNPSKNVAICCTSWRVLSGDSYVFDP
jgi:hypothetical protein